MKFNCQILMVTQVGYSDFYYKDKNSKNENFYNTNNIGFLGLSLLLSW